MNYKQHEFNSSAMLLRAFMKNIKNYDLFNFSPFLLLIWGIISILFFEKMPLYNGFGWDGRLYGNLAIDFENIIRNHSLEAYAVQRIFPSFIIYDILQLLHLPHTVGNMWFLVDVNF
jgi:hypothetical protein